MPTVVFKAEDRGNPGFKDLFYALPLKNGQDGSLVDLRKQSAGLCIKTPSLQSAEAGGVLVWAYGGAERVERKGAKRFMPADEVAFLDRHFPGLLETIVGEGGGPDDVTPVLLEKTQAAERERDVAVAEAQQAKNALASVSAAHTAAEQAATKIAVDVQNRDARIAELEAKLAAAEALAAANVAAATPTDDGKKSKK